MSTLGQAHDPDGDDKCDEAEQQSVNSHRLPCSELWISVQGLMHDADFLFGLERIAHHIVAIVLGLTAARTRERGEDAVKRGLARDVGSQDIENQSSEKRHLSAKPRANARQIRV